MPVNRHKITDAGLFHVARIINPLRKEPGKSPAFAGKTYPRSILSAAARASARPEILDSAIHRIRDVQTVEAVERYPVRKVETASLGCFRFTPSKQAPFPPGFA